MALPTSPNEDLWGFNPQSNRLYTVGERRNQLRDREYSAGKLPAFQSVLPDSKWDEWFDRVHTNRTMQTAGIDPTAQNAAAQLQQIGSTPGGNEALLKRLGGQTVKWGADSSPQGSNQLRGSSSLPGGRTKASLKGLQSAYGQESDWSTDELVEGSQKSRRAGEALRRSYR